MGNKTQAGTGESGKYKYRGETGWELSAESTSTGENGNRKHRLGTECREYKYRGEWDGNTGWELNAESTM